MIVRIKKKKKYHTVKTIPNSNNKVIESDKLDIPNT